MTIDPLPQILKFADWPLQDRQSWERCLGPGKLFDTGGGAFSGWSAGTIRYHQQAYGTWLSFILRMRPELIDAPPAVRANQDTVAQYIEESRIRRKSRSIENQILSLATVLQGFAPGTSFGWLYRAGEKIRSESMPRQLKPPYPVKASDLFQWSIDHLQALRSQQAGDPIRIATEYRQALTIGLLISRPVRARAFVAMTVSRHLEINNDKVVLNFEAQDMKDKKARRFPVPPTIAGFLIEYLEVFRPVLLDGRESDALWISSRGNPLNQDSFTGGLALLTLRVFGIRLRPHAFRHIAATSIAVDDPANAGIIRDILGHSTIRMAEVHYNRATGQEVSSQLQKILQKKRKIRSGKRRAIRSSNNGSARSLR